MKNSFDKSYRMSHTLCTYWVIHYGTYTMLHHVSTVWVTVWVKVWTARGCPGIRRSGDAPVITSIIQTMRMYVLRNNDDVIRWRHTSGRPEYGFDTMTGTLTGDGGFLYGEFDCVGDRLWYGGEALWRLICWWFCSWRFWLVTAVMYGLFRNGRWLCEEFG